jgi:hypothetical protein
VFRIATAHGRVGRVADDPELSYRFRDLSLVATLARRDCRDHDEPIAASAADLKFLHHLPQARSGTSNR